MALTRTDYLALVDRLHRAMDNPKTTLGEIKEIRDKMKHQHEWKKVEPHGGAACIICTDYSDRWYCPKSPDHLCHYDKGDYDSCDFCGEPEERK